MLGLKRKLFRNERGQALVEISLIMPILLLLLFGIIDFGRIFHAYLLVTNAVREGARIGVVGAADTVICQTVKDSAVGLDAASINPNVAPAEGSRVRGAELSVSVDYPVSVYTPIISSIIGASFTVHASSTMRVE